MLRTMPYLVILFMSLASRTGLLKNCIPNNRRMVLTAPEHELSAWLVGVVWVRRVCVGVLQRGESGLRAQYCMLVVLPCSSVVC